MKTYHYIQDPGHGWLRVPLTDLPEVFHPSPYSFKDATFAYLEEDCDLSAFVALVPSFNVREVLVRSFNRNIERFSGIERAQ